MGFSTPFLPIPGGPDRPWRVGSRAESLIVLQIRIRLPGPRDLGCRFLCIPDGIVLKRFDPVVPPMDVSDRKVVVYYSPKPPGIYIL